MDDEVLKPELIQRYIDKFEKAAKSTTHMQRNTADSLKWFQRRVSKDILSRRTALFTDHGDYVKRKASGAKTLIGKLYYYKYEAEMPGSKKAPVYDEYPMVFFFNSYKSTKGKTILLGLNLHYLTPKERNFLLTHLLKYKSNGKLSAKSRLRAQWNVIKRFGDVAYKAVHQYRADRFQTQMIEIHPEDWEIAVFLRLEKFVPVGEHSITSQSGTRKMIQK